MAQMTKTHSRLGTGKHAVVFGGVQQQQSSRFARLVLVGCFTTPRASSRSSAGLALLMAPYAVRC